MTLSGQREAARFAAALSTRAETTAAVEEVCDTAMAQLGKQPDLAMVFVSPHHVENLAQLAEQVCDAIGCDSLLG
ncbi:MAG TPA: hypothetical protein VGJ04_12590, partial [Pirellulales bacterium]